jgi:ATP synthase protein I
LDEKDRRYLRMLGLLSLVGFTPLFTTAIGFFIGLWLDRKFGSTPWLTGVFTVVGIYTGFRDVYRYIKKSQSMSDEDNNKKDDHH